MHVVRRSRELRHFRQQQRLAARKRAQDRRPGCLKRMASRDVGVRHLSGLWRGTSWQFLVSATADACRSQITRTSSFSAEAAPGSAQVCPRQAYGVPEAHGIARCGRTAPIRLVERYKLTILVSATTADARGADQENFVVFGRSTAWQHDHMLQIGVRGAGSVWHCATCACDADQACGEVRADNPGVCDDSRCMWR